METQNLAHDSLTEVEAARRLGVTVEALYRILDEHIFNTGAPRPEALRFTHADLLMLSYWCEPPRNGKVVSMPKRCG